MTIIANSSFGQFPIAVDSLYSFIKYNSIYRNKVDWNPVDNIFNENINTSKSLKDTMMCFVKVLEKLNDVHSQIYLNNEAYSYYEQYNDTISNWLRPLIEKSSNQINKIYTKQLEEKYAYILVPGMQAYEKVQINKLAQSVRNRVKISFQFQAIILVSANYLLRRIAALFNEKDGTDDAKRMASNWEVILTPFLIDLIPTNMKISHHLFSLILGGQIAVAPPQNYSRRKVVLKEPELQYIHNQHSKPSKPF